MILTEVQKMKKWMCSLLQLRRWQQSGFPGLVAGSWRRELWVCSPDKRETERGDLEKWLIQNCWRLLCTITWRWFGFREFSRMVQN